MFYQSPYILIIGTASFFVLNLLRTKGKQMHIFGCICLTMGFLRQIQSPLLSANNNETQLLNTVLYCFIGSILFFYYLREKQYSVSILHNHHNKTEDSGNHPICIGSYMEWTGNDSRYRKNVSKCDVNFTQWTGNVPGYRKNVSKCDMNFKKWTGNDSRWSENVSICDVNFKKWTGNVSRFYLNLKKRIRKQVSKTRNKIASCRNIIYYLSLITSNFNNCLRVHSNRVYLFDLKKEKDANRITDRYLEKHNFRIIISKSWLNFKDRSPPLGTYKIG